MLLEDSDAPVFMVTTTDDGNHTMSAIDSVATLILSSTCRSQGDFTIKVLSLVMSSQWPFFKAMKESRMEESKSGQLELDYPVEWIEAVVPLKFDLPQRLLEAMERIKKENLDLNQAMLGFKQAHKTQNEPVRMYFSTKIKTLMGLNAVADEQLQSFSQDQLVQLFRDLNGLQMGNAV